MLIPILMVMLMSWRKLPGNLLWEQGILCNPPLHNLTVDELPESERYSYIYRGNAQMLDHFLASELDQMELSEIAYVRGNADNSEGYEKHEDVLFRVSDHDGLVAFFRLPAPVDREDEVILPAALSITYPNPFLPFDQIRIELPTAEEIDIRLFSMGGKLVDEIRQGGVGAGVYKYGLRGDLPFGVYVLEVKGKNYLQREKLLIGRN